MSLAPIEPLDAHRQRRVLASICMASATMPMVFTGPAVALGSMADELSASAAALAWVTNAFMLAFGSCLLVAGALADRLGRRRVFRLGVVLFLLASTALPFVSGMGVFNLLRAVQGIAGAAIFAGGAAALAQEFDGAARTSAFSWLGTSFGIGLVLGPITAGALSAAWGWRAIFWLVIVMMAVAALLGLKAMRESRNTAADGFDWPGAAVFTLALTVLTCAALTVAERGWTDTLVLGGLGAAALLFALFVHIERRSASPMLDLSLFRYRRFLGVQLLAAAPAYAYVVLLVLLPIRFAGIEGTTASTTGWLMGALSAPLLVLPLLAGRAARWCPPAVLCSAGLLMAAGGLVWLAQAANGFDAIPAMVLIGAGISLPWGLMDGLAVSVVPVERAGMAAGIFSTVRVAGEGVALALVGSTLASLIHGRLPTLVEAHPIAQLLASGRLDQALQLHPGMPSATLTHAYESAFSTLLQGLSAITVLTAIVVLLSMGATRSDPEQQHGH